MRSEADAAGAPPTGRRADLARRGAGLGPGVLWMMLALATGGLERWSYLVAKYGLTFLWLLVPAALLPLPTTLAVARFTRLTGESVVTGLRHAHRELGALVWLLASLSLLALGTFATAAGTALAALTQIPGSFAMPGRTLLWACVTVGVCALVTAGARAGAARPVVAVAAMAALTTLAVAIWACSHPEVGIVAPTFLAGFLGPSAPSAHAWDVHDARLLLAGLGLTGLAGFWNVLYSYWLGAPGRGIVAAAEVDALVRRDAAARPEPDRPPVAAAPAWIAARRRDLAAAAVGAGGSFVVTAAACLLAYALLYPRGLVPRGDALAVVEGALRDAPWGPAARVWLPVVIVAVSASAWVASADGLGRLAADVFPRPRDPDGRRAYASALAIAVLVSVLSTFDGMLGALRAVAPALGFAGAVMLPPALYVLNQQRLAPALPSWGRPSRLETISLAASAVVSALLAALYAWMTFG